MMLDTPSKTFVEHTQNFNDVIDVIRGIFPVVVCISIAVFCSLFVITSSFIRQSVQVLHKEGLRTVISACCVNITIEKMISRSFGSTSPESSELIIRSTL